MASDEYNGKLVWFLAGAAIGAAIALLYAPASGKETRRRLAEKAAEQADALSGVGKEWVEKGKDLYDKGRQMAEEAADIFDRGKKMVQG
jgi:gas vesicle protein